MTIDHDEEALREVLRQGERMVQVQQESRESALRRAAELLRLAVGILGGLVVVGGIFSAASVRPDGVALTALAVGVALETFSIFVFSSLLAGHGRFGVFAYGPDLQRPVDEMGRRELREDILLLTLIRSIVEMVQVSALSIGHMQRAKGNALYALTLGSILLLGSILYIIVRAMHA